MAYILSKPTGCTPPRVDPHVNCGLWIMCQCRLMEQTSRSGWGHRWCRRLSGGGQEVHLEAMGPMRILYLMPNFPVNLNCSKN